MAHQIAVTPVLHGKDAERFERLRKEADAGKRVQIVVPPLDMEKIDAILAKLYPKK